MRTVNRKQRTYLTPMDTAITQAQPIQAEIVESQSLLQCEFSNEDELIIAWLREKSPSTAKTYLNAVRDFFEFGGALNTTFSTLQNWRESLSQRYKVSTANKKLSAIRSLLKFALEMGYLRVNPASKLRSIPNSKDKDKQGKSVTERIIPHSEIKQLVASASNQRDRLMIKTCYLLGLRIHELLNLHWQDFSRKGNDQWQVKIIGKNSKERFLGVPSDLMHELKQLNTDGYIFQSYQGKKMSPVAAHKMLKKVIDRAGLSEEISWHWLRHCCASHSLENGASLEAVRKKLGHSSIAVTNIYLHTQEDANQFISI